MDAGFGSSGLFFRFASIALAEFAVFPVVFLVFRCNAIGPTSFLYAASARRSGDFVDNKAPLWPPCRANGLLLPIPHFPKHAPASFGGVVRLPAAAATAHPLPFRCYLSASSPARPPVIAMCSRLALHRGDRSCPSLRLFFDGAPVLADVNVIRSPTPIAIAPAAATAVAVSAVALSSVCRPHPFNSGCRPPLLAPLGIARCTQSLASTAAAAVSSMARLCSSGSEGCHLLPSPLVFTPRSLPTASVSAATSSAATSCVGHYYLNTP